MIPPIITRAARIFLLLKDGDTCSIVDKQISKTRNYASIQRIIALFEASGLIYFQREGREKKIYLTDKGKKIKKSLIPLGGI